MNQSSFFNEPTCCTFPAAPSADSSGTAPPQPAVGCYSTMNMYGVGGNFRQTIFAPTPVSTNFEYRYPGKASVASIQRFKNAGY